MKCVFYAVLALLCSIPAWSQRESLYSSLNAYNPIPSPDGTQVAFVETGWNRPGGSGGFGRSNMVSNLRFADSSGHLEPTSSLDCFGDRWIDSETFSCYRDYRFGLVTGTGWQRQGAIPEDNPQTARLRPERAAYSTWLATFVWMLTDKTGTYLESPSGAVAKLDLKPWRDDLMVIPSPNGRFLAITGNNDAHMWVFDLNALVLADLGPIRIHPAPDWDYMKPSWDPWFRDSSALTFTSGENLIVASPDGLNCRTIAKGVSAALPVPSPDGKYIAYASFAGHPMGGRKDLTFWGNGTISLVQVDNGRTIQVTRPVEATTLTLRWLNPSTLIFDRLPTVSDHPPKSGLRP